MAGEAPPTSRPRRNRPTRSSACGPECCGKAMVSVVPASCRRCRGAAAGSRRRRLSEWDVRRGRSCLLPARRRRYDATVRVPRRRREVVLVIGRASAGARDAGGSVRRAERREDLRFSSMVSAAATCWGDRVRLASSWSAVCWPRRSAASTRPSTPPRALSAVAPPESTSKARPTVTWLAPLPSGRAEAGSVPGGNSAITSAGDSHRWAPSRKRR